MAEVMGMDPVGVQALIRRLESGKSVLAGLRPGLEAAIAEAGADWAGTGGVTAMHRAWAFFHDSQADLRWRLQVLSQVLPTGSPALTWVSVSFLSQEQAAAAGTREGAAVADALAAHLADGTPSAWAAVEAAMTSGGTADARDPAYAAAFLAALGGPDRLRTLFGRWMDAHTGGPGRGLALAQLQAAQASLGTLAVAFTSAEASGRLPDGWREDVLTRANPATLSAMVALARPSGAFLNEVAIRQFGSHTAGFSAAFPDPDWNTALVVGAYAGDPESLQKLLADHKQVAGQLLSPDLVKGTGTPGFADLLAMVLDRALDPQTGSAGTREQAWINVINGVGYDGTEELVGHYASFENSSLNQVLAKNLTPYLGELARGQVHAHSPELGVSPSGPWKNLDVDVAARFVGALMQDPGTVKTLQADFQAHVRDLDIGRAHPFSSDPLVRTEYTRLSAEAGGLSNLILGGSAYAEFNDDEFIDVVSDAAMLPVDYAVGRVTTMLDLGDLTSAAVGSQADGPKEKVADILKDYLDKKTQDTAEVVTRKLVDVEVDAVLNSLEAHGQEPLTAADADQIRQAFAGRLSPALIKALAARGG
ncbi:hypothetical protein Aph01nite_46490 [Acrocarpospora phusangensis]|uniref:Uncharacterized protein n=1 Tax=Acrocarpospora phusangensis TaxID=1070424 RepID=A0A919QBW0_9ACTN|nr:hypothetical protein [Acrocarpospora phusangensis]GIH26339.1 hypothetical protein Aph01nite_46490 [Acrocarpospora phusangensis]